LEGQNDRFVLYEYLLFFWKKKWMFLIVPLIFMILAASISLFQPRSYVGSSTTYIGPVKEETLVRTDLITSEYREEVSSKVGFLVIIPADGRVMFRVTGQDKNTVKKELDKVTNAYLKDVNIAYKEMKSINDNDIAFFESRITSLNSDIKEFTAKIESNTLSPSQVDSFIGMVAEMEDKTADYQSDLRSVLEEKEDMIQPKIISEEINKEQGNLATNVIVGLILGLVFAVLALILWKYILDAKGVRYRD
jgi:hypothetical protein